MAWRWKMRMVQHGVMLTSWRKSRQAAGGQLGAPLVGWQGRCDRCSDPAVLAGRHRMLSPSPRCYVAAHAPASQPIWFSLAASGW